MSTLSQFFNNDAVSSTGITTFIGSSGSLTIPSTAKYIGYGVMGAGGSSFCYTQSCWDPGNNGTGNSGGGFSWWEGATTYGTPTNLTITIGTTAFQANGGTTCITGGPQNICATGGCICMGGCGVGGLINTKGGINSCSLTRTCCINGCCCGACWKGAASSGGGAGGLLGCGGRGCINSSTWECAGGGGYGSGGGPGWPSGDGGSAFGQVYTQASDTVLPPVNNHVGSTFGNTQAFSLGYNCLGSLSQAKTYLSAQGSGSSCNTAAGQGGGGSTYAAAGFGGGAGASTGCWWACIGQPGCGGGGGFAQYSSCCCGCCACAAFGCGGNGFAIVEYWNR